MTTKGFAKMMREQYKSSEQYRDTQTNYSGEDARIEETWAVQLPNDSSNIKLIPHK